MLPTVRLNANYAIIRPTVSLIQTARLELGRDG